LYPGPRYRIVADGARRGRLVAFILLLGRYVYAVLDDTGRVLFSSLKDRSPIFSADPHSSDVAYLEARHGYAAISGVSLVKEADPAPLWSRSKIKDHNCACSTA
jgi:hypothetical protein